MINYDIFILMENATVVGNFNNLMLFQLKTKIVDKNDEQRRTENGPFDLLYARDVKSIMSYSFANLQDGCYCSCIFVDEN